MPTAIKDDRHGGRELEMDTVQQVIVRTMCLDGYSIGVEVGRRLAAREMADKEKKEDLSASGQLTNCFVQVCVLS